MFCAQIDSPCLLTSRVGAAQRTWPWMMMWVPTHLCLYTYYIPLPVSLSLHTIPLYIYVCSYPGTLLYTPVCVFIFLCLRPHPSARVDIPILHPSTVPVLISQYLWQHPTTRVLSRATSLREVTCISVCKKLHIAWVRERKIYYVWLISWLCVCWCAC